MSKRAIITGITGQDGSYLAELLLEQGYEVVPRHPPSQWRRRAAPHAEAPSPRRRREVNEPGWMGGREILYHHLPNWPEDRIRPLMETFGSMLMEQRVYREVFGVI